MSFLTYIIACKITNPREVKNVKKDGGDTYLAWAITMTVGCVLTFVLGFAINFYQMTKTIEFKTKLANITGL